MSTQLPEPNDLDSAAQKLIGDLPPEPWASWPGGWPDQIELAVLDAVFSIRARFGKRAEDGRAATGVHRVLGNWRSHQKGSDLDDLEALAEFHGRPGRLAQVLKNDAKTSGRPKAEVAAEVAHSFISGEGLTVRHANQFPDAGEDQKELRKRWVGTHGLGPVTWSYLCMLLGHPDVKADVMIRRYLQRVLGLGQPPSPKEAREIVTLAAKGLGKPEITATDLDHAIWSYEHRR